MVYNGLLLSSATCKSQGCISVYERFNRPFGEGCLNMIAEERHVTHMSKIHVDGQDKADPEKVTTCAR